MQTFSVHFSTGRPAEPNQGVTNTYGLRGAGQLSVDDTHLTFTGERAGFNAGPVRLPRAEIANVEYNESNGAFLLRSRSGDSFLVFWTSSPDDATAIWALLPHDKTPEFIAEKAHHERYARTMSELGQRAPVTPVIIALNVIMFGAVVVAGADPMSPASALLIRFGSNFGPLTWSGEEWRLLSSAFLHGGLLHIVLNMFALYQGGALVERLYGSARFTLVYLLAAIAGSVASAWWDPYRNSVGASGAIFGVYGALLAFFALRRADFPPSLWKGIGTSALMFCGYSLAVGAAHPAIDNTAHIGGLLGGMLSGALLVRPFEVAARRRPQPLRLVAAALAVLLPLAWLTQPMAASGAERAAEWRLGEAVRAFGVVDTELRRKFVTLAEQAMSNPGLRFEVADRLRDEVLVPWRESARAILDTPRLQGDSRAARFQPTYRAYLLAMDQAVGLRIEALREDTPGSRARAEVAEARVIDLLKTLRADAGPGT